MNKLFKRQRSTIITSSNIVIKENCTCHLFLLYNNAKNYLGILYLKMDGVFTGQREKGNRLKNWMEVILGMNDANSADGKQ